MPESSGQRRRWCPARDPSIDPSTTSTRASPAVFRPDIDLDGTTTKVLVDQMAAVDGGLRLADMVGRLSAQEMTEVDLAVRLVLGLL